MYSCLVRSALAASHATGSVCLQFLKNQAKDMMNGQGSQTKGAQASTGGGGWASDLQKLAGHTEAAEQQKGGGASLDDVKGLLGGSSSGKLLVATGRGHEH